MNMPSHALQSTLEKGYSYDTFKALEGLCALGCRQSPAAQDRVTFFTLEAILFWLAEDLAGEVTTETHKYIEDVIWPHVRVVIESFESGDINGRMEALDDLIKGLRLMPLSVTI